MGAATSINGTAITTGKKAGVQMRITTVFGSNSFKELSIDAAGAAAGTAPEKAIFTPGGSKVSNPELKSHHATTFYRCPTMEERKTSYFNKGWAHHGEEERKAKEADRRERHVLQNSHFRSVGFCVGAAHILEASILDLQDEGVGKMLALAQGMPLLEARRLANQVKFTLLPADERERILAARRAKIRQNAEAKLKAFRSMGDEEKKALFEEGDINLYSDDNQAKREFLFEEHTLVNALLDKWWKAASLYIDVNRDGVVQKKEYKAFHKRLLLLAEFDHGEGEDEMSKAEATATMEEDFKLDGGTDGKITREEFRHAVFELADQWTASVEAEEYMAFLNRGYEIVFSEMIKKDKLILPLSWVKLLTRVKIVHCFPHARVVDICSEILATYARTAADKQPAMNLFVNKHFKMKFGTGKLYRKQLKGFVLGLTKLMKVKEAERHDYVVLFAQMCGIFAPSGRVKSMSEDATRFVVKHICGVQDIRIATSKKINETGSSRYKSTSVAHNPLAARHSTNSRAHLVTGHLELELARKYLETVLRKELRVKTKSSVFKIAMLSLLTLSEEVKWRTGWKVETTVDLKSDVGGACAVISCLHFATLLAIVFEGKVLASNDPETPGSDDVAYNDYVTRMGLAEDEASRETARKAAFGVGARSTRHSSHKPKEN